MSTTETAESTNVDKPPFPHLVPAEEPVDTLIARARNRALSLSNRLADRITAFSGSMKFVLIHVIWFSSWIAFGVEPYPYLRLTMLVALEAIFLSSFVMISQNRAAEKRELIADQQRAAVQEEDKQDEELLDVSHQILELTKAVHAATGAQDPRR